MLFSGDEVSSFHTGLSYEVSEVGLLQTRRVPAERLLVLQLYLHMQVHIYTCIYMHSK